MAISTFDGFVDAQFNRSQVYFAFPLTAVPAAATSHFSWWTTSGMNGNGATPPAGSGATCLNTTQGAVPIQAPTGGNSLYLGMCNFAASVTNTVYVADRMVHTSGLSGTVTTAQAVNTVALPARAGSGVGVYAAAEIYTATGATTVTATLTYTNSAGTPGRVVTASFLGGNIGRYIIFPLAAGDLGVQSVQTIQLSATTTGAGNFGITLFKPLASVAGGAAAHTTPMISVFDVGTPLINSASCLFFYMLASASTTMSSYFISILEGL